MVGPAKPQLLPEVLTAMLMLGRSSTATISDASLTSTLPMSCLGFSSIGGDECGRLGDLVLLVVVSLLEATFDGDDPLRVGHLELEVGVVGDGHELGKAWSTEEDVVDTEEVDDLEGEWLLVEVVQLAEGDIEPDAP